MRNPWKKLSSKIIYQDPWITLREDKVIRPDGSRGRYGVVDMSGGVQIVALTSKREIYLVGQWRYAINRFSWGLPGGSVGKNQDFLKAAKNELKEEVGLRAKNWQYIGMGYESVGVLKQKMKFYLATNLTETTRKLDGSEKGMRITKMPLPKAIKLISQNKIFDNSSIVGIFKALEYLKKI